MPTNGKTFLRRWMVTTLGVAVAANVVSGISYDNWPGLLLAALLLGLLTAFLRPILVVLALPLVLVTLGLFMLVINALLLWLVGSVLHSFHVRDFWAAFWGGLVISLVSMAVNTLLGTNEEPAEPAPRKRVRRKKRKIDKDGDGPIIDV